MAPPGTPARKRLFVTGKNWSKLFGIEIIGEMIPTDTKNDTLQALSGALRILPLLDGGFGTMVQGYGLQEEAYRGERFRTGTSSSRV